MYFFSTLANKIVLLTRVVVLITLIVGADLTFNRLFAADKYTELPRPLAKYDASALIHISSPAQAKAVRQKVVEFFWPNGKLPTAKLPSASEVYAGKGAVPGDLKGVDAALVARAERLSALVDFDYHHVSYLLHPAAQSKTKRLVILHQGHGGRLTEGILALSSVVLKRGSTVLLMQMPLVGWNTDNTFKTPGGLVTISKRGTSGHNQMVSALEGRGGSSLRFFIEPVVMGINYFIRQYPAYGDISMIGLSGGGWTTQIAAAIDDRIKLSIPVAGSTPLYVRPHYPGSTGDKEQILPALYKDRASWLDLYILGGYGKARRQIQLFNQFDTCCFYGIGYKTYADKVSAAVKRLGQGQWTCKLDSSHRKHKISEWAIKTIIDPALHNSSTRKLKSK